MACFLEKDLRVAFLHLDGAGTAIEKRAEVIEGAAEIEVGEVGVPVLVGLERLDKALAFARGLLVPRLDETGLAEHAVGGRGADGDDSRSRFE
jgi:hypothetical protein